MKWIKYQVVQSANNGEPICITKKVDYNEANLAIAKVEAYNGQYTVEEDENNFTKEPLAIELGGTGASSAEEALLSLGINPENIGAARIVHGSYTGTGKSGSDNPNKLTFPFDPKIVIVVPEKPIKDSIGYTPRGLFMIAIKGCTQAMTSFSITSLSSGSEITIASLTWTSNSLSWYADDRYTQFNSNYTGENKYYYIAIG